MSDIETYVDAIFTGLEGWVYAPTLDRLLPKPINFKAKYFEWPKQREQLIDHLETSSRRYETYIAPVVLSKPNAKKQFFKATNYFWADFDGNAPAENALGEFPSPTIKVQSSGPYHEHWYWRLDRALTDSAGVERLNRTVVERFRADSSGWDATQVLRVPGTTHRKDSENIRTVRFLGINLGLVYSTEALDRFVSEPVRLPRVAPDVNSLLLTRSFSEPASKLILTRERAEGTRSSGLMELAYLLAESGFSDDEMYSVLDYVDSNWGKFEGRDDKNRQLDRIIEVARVKYPEEELEEFIPVMGFRTMLETEVEINWLIEGILQDAGYLLLVGPPGTGKTNFSLYVSLNLALGRPILNYPATDSCRIVFISAEMALPEIKLFGEEMARHPDFSDSDLDILEENLIMVPYGEAINLDTKNGQQTLEEIIQTYQPSLVVFDSVGSAMAGDLNDNVAVRAMLSWTESIRKRYGCAFWFIHHQRKASGDNKVPSTQADIFGSMYFAGKATTVLCLWPTDKSDVLDLLALKVRLSAVPEPRRLKKTKHLSFSLKTMPDAATQANLSLAETLRAHLSNGLDGDVEV